MGDTTRRCGNEPVDSERSPFRLYIFWTVSLEAEGFPPPEKLTSSIHFVNV
jgi:hypothetical protein